MQNDIITIQQVQDAIQYVAQHTPNVDDIPNHHRDALLRATEDQMCEAFNSYASNFPDNYDPEVDQDGVEGSKAPIFSLYWTQLLQEDITKTHLKTEQTLQNTNLTLQVAKNTIDDFFLSKLCDIIDCYKDRFYHSHRYTWPSALSLTQFLYIVRRDLIEQRAPQALRADLRAYNHQAMQEANNQQVYQNLNLANHQPLVNM